MVMYARIHMTDISHLRMEFEFFMMVVTVNKTASVFNLPINGCRLQLIYKSFNHLAILFNPLCLSSIVLNCLVLVQRCLSST